MKLLLLAAVLAQDGGYNGIQEIVHNGSALTMDGDLCFEGATADAFEACFAYTDPTSDKTITFQDVTGTVYVSSGTDVALADGGTNASLTAVNGGVCYSSASALALTAAGTTNQLLQSAGAAAPTWSSTVTAAVHHNDDVLSSFGNTAAAPDSTWEHDTSTTPDETVLWSTDTDGAGADGAVVSNPPCTHHLITRRLLAGQSFMILEGRRVKGALLS